MGMPLKKKLIVEACKWDGKNYREFLQFCSKEFCHIFNNRKENLLELSLLREDAKAVKVPVNHYVIKGLDGVFYPVSPEAFADNELETKPKKKAAPKKQEAAPVEQEEEMIIEDDAGK